MYEKTMVRKLGEFSNEHTLRTDDYEMLVIANL
jgi:hypothetical protein